MIDIIAPIFRGFAPPGQRRLQYPVEQVANYIEIIEGPVEIIIRPWEPTRSPAYNAYYWKVPINLLSDFTGNTPEETHDDLKRRFLFMFAEDSTKLLTTSQFRTYLEFVQRWSAQSHGIYIPDPNEVYVTGKNYVRPLVEFK